MDNRAQNSVNIRLEKVFQDTAKPFISSKGFDSLREIMLLNEGHTNSYSREKAPKIYHSNIPFTNIVFISFSNTFLKQSRWTSYYLEDNNWTLKKPFIALNCKTDKYLWNTNVIWFYLSLVWHPFFSNLHQTIAMISAFSRNVVSWHKHNSILECLVQDVWK